jgi:serine O-acetyltransferase
MLLADLRAKQRLYSEYGPAASLLKVLVADGTSAIVLFRLMTFLADYRLKPFALIVHILNKWINGCVIGIGCRFGPGFILIHPIGVVINSKVCGGSNVWVESGVVIGENRGKCPQLGNDIFIGSGAKVIGDILVGSNSRIGANAVVLYNVAEGDTVVGIPARPNQRKASQ